MSNYVKYLVIVLLLIMVSDHNILNCKNIKKIKKEIKNEI